MWVVIFSTPPARPVNTELLRWCLGLFFLRGTVRFVETGSISLPKHLKPESKKRTKQQWASISVSCCCCILLGLIKFIANLKQDTVPSGYELTLVPLT